MNTVLGKEESVIKEWEYANVKVGKTSITKTLRLTNKRIINITESDNLIHCDEITNKDVSSVDAKLMQGNFKLYLILALISLVGAIICFAVGSTIGAVLLAVAMVGMIALAVINHKLLFEVSIKKKTNEIEAFTIGEIVIEPQKKSKKSKKKKKDVVKVKMKPDVARDICVTLNEYLFA